MSQHDVLRTEGKMTSLISVDTPLLEADELLVEPLFVGVCGTDLQIIRRQRPDPATILGHEGIARIIQEANTKKGLLHGGNVVFNSVDPTDQNQILGHNTPGLLQKRYVASKHAVANDLAVPFPQSIDPILGALVEPLATVVYGHSLVSKVTKQTCIVIVGAGAIGIMHALYARSQGYEKILLINASKDRLEWCVRRGIIKKEDTFLDSRDVHKKILAATDGVGVDAVYMCTSRPNALTALRGSLQYVKEGGCIDLVGGIKDGDTIDELPQIVDLNSIRRANFCGIPPNGYVKKTKTSSNKGVYITGHRGTSFQHFQTTIKALQSHGEMFKKVISHIVSLEAAAGLFNEIARGSLKNFNGTLYTKAIIDMNETGKTVHNT